MCSLKRGFNFVCLQAQQVQPDRFSATATTRRGRKWIKADNEDVVKCYLKRNPDVRGYGTRMLKIWTDRGMLLTTDKFLTAQLRQIKRNKWIADVEWEATQRKLRVDDGVENEESQNNYDDVSTAEEEINIFPNTNSLPSSEIEDIDNSMLLNVRIDAGNMEEEDLALVQTERDS